MTRQSGRTSPMISDSKGRFLLRLNELDEKEKRLHSKIRQMEERE